MLMRSGTMTRTGIAVITVVLLLIGVLPLPVSAGDRTLPDGFVGTWTGAVREAGATETYPVKIQLSGGSTGEVVGTIAYPSFGCIGDVVLLAIDPDAAVVSLREEIDSSAGCGGDATFRLQLRDDQTLGWTWFWDDGEIGAEATLTRQDRAATADAPTGNLAHEIDNLATLIRDAVSDASLPALDDPEAADLGPMARQFLRNWSDTDIDADDRLDRALAVQSLLAEDWDTDYLAATSQSPPALIPTLLRLNPGWIPYRDAIAAAPTHAPAIDAAVTAATGLSPGDVLLPSEEIGVNGLLIALPPEHLAAFVTTTGANLDLGETTSLIRVGEAILAEIPAATVLPISLDDLPPEALVTLDAIVRGGPFPYDQDGIVFGNREGILPDADRGYYREYTVETPGLSHRGARRIVTGDSGEIYYTDTHYDRFFVVLLEND